MPDDVTPAEQRVLDAIGADVACQCYLTSQLPICEHEQTAILVALRAYGAEQRAATVREVDAQLMYGVSFVQCGNCGRKWTPQEWPDAPCNGGCEWNR